MTQYIDKDALIAEIKKRIDFCNKIADASAERNLHYSLEANELLIRQYENLLYFLNSLEVKEVDSTDAFIEKATEWLKENKDHPLIGCEDICLNGYLTDEFIEDFKNYMKGE